VFPGSAARAAGIFIERIIDGLIGVNEVMRGEVVGKFGCPPPKVTGDG
jgi:hypothetical protein